MPSGTQGIPRNVNTNSMKTKILIITIFSTFSLLSQSFQTHFETGNNLFIQGKYNEAVTNFSKAIKSDTANAQGYYSRGLSYFRLEQDSLAINDFDKAIKLNPSEPSLYYSRGESKRFSGNPSGAHSDYNKAISLDSTFYSAYLGRAYLFQSKSMTHMAWIYFNLAIKYNPNLPATVYFSRGYGYQESNALNQAIDDYNKAIELDSNYTDAYINKGNCLISLNKPNEALGCFNKTLKLNPTYALAYYQKGNAQYALKQNKEACLNWKKSLELGAQYANKTIEEFCK